MLASLIVAIVKPSPAQAYSLENVYWINNFSINFHIDSLTSKDRDGFNAGLSAWNGSPAPVIFSSSNDPNYVETWDENDGANNTPGWNYNITQSPVCLHSGFAPLHIADVVFNTYYTNNYPSGEIQYVAGHELGHGIGLGHSTIPSALMYPNVSAWVNYGTKTPQTDDVNGANKIYSTPCN